MPHRKFSYDAQNVCLTAHPLVRPSIGLLRESSQSLEKIAVSAASCLSHRSGQTEMSGLYFKLISVCVQNVVPVRELHLLACACSVWQENCPALPEAVPLL